MIGFIFNRISFLFLVLSSTSFAKPGKKVVVSRYNDLVRELDIYETPKEANKIIPLKDFYFLLKEKGLSIKIAREDFNTNKENIEIKDRAKLPKLSLDASSSQNWSRKYSDSDFSDLINDREKFSSSKSIATNLGLTLQGSPMTGLNYSLNIPTFSHQNSFPGSTQLTPKRLDTSTIGTKVGFSLLKDSILTTKSLYDKKEKYDRDKLDQNFKSQTLKAVQEAEQVFFDLIQKYIKLKIEDRNHKLAIALNQDIQDMVDVGESDKMALLSSNLQKSQAEVSYMSAELDYKNAYQGFKQMYQQENSKELIFPDPKVLKTRPQQPEIKVDEILNQAKENKPEFIQAKQSLEESEISFELSKQARLPKLDFEVGYNNSTSDDGFFKTVQESMKINDRTFSMGLSFNYILYNNENFSSFTQAVNAKQKALYSFELAQQNLVKEVHSLKEKIDMSFKKLVLVEMGREIAEKKISAEYEKFKVGESTVKNVIDAQTEVNNARVSELSARIDVFNNISALRSLTGQLPEGISF